MNVGTDGKYGNSRLDFHQYGQKSSIEFRYFPSVWTENIPVYATTNLCFGQNLHIFCLHTVHCEEPLLEIAVMVSVSHK